MLAPNPDAASAFSGPDASYLICYLRCLTSLQMLSDDIYASFVDAVRDHFHILSSVSLGKWPCACGIEGFDPCPLRASSSTHPPPHTHTLHPATPALIAVQVAPFVEVKDFCAREVR